MAHPLFGPLLLGRILEQEFEHLAGGQMGRQIIKGTVAPATEYRPFVNYDAKYRFKFNSGTVQNDAIKLRGKMVKIKKYGWRLPIFSIYENVVKIKEVKESSGHGKP